MLVSLQRYAIVGMIGGLAWIGACSLTNDLSGITGGTAGGGGAGTGGSPGEPCTVASECPPPSSSCETAICLGGLCGLMAVANGTPLPEDEQTAGDCLELICDGRGEVTERNDEEDAPETTDCATYSCNSGVLVTAPANTGTPCNNEQWLCDGAGTCVECFTPTDCPLPGNLNCGERRCTNHACDPVYVADGTPLDPADQNAGDCKVRVCDGQGGDRIDNDDSDTPDDENLCTIDSCEGGDPVFDYAQQGTSCGTSGTGVCNDSGQCVGCVDALDCGQTTYCRTWSCNPLNGGTCMVTYRTPGTPLPPGDQQPGDCQELVCGVNGSVVSDDDNDDLPPDEPNDCTAELCISGTPHYEDEQVNTPCGADWWCDGLGTCVECNDAAQCDVPPKCVLATCNAHACGTTNAPDGTPTGEQIDGDCKLEVCDGQGGTRQEPQDTDLPVDGNECTDDLCNGGVPSNPPTPPGSDCTLGGTVCDGAGHCVQCTLDIHCAANQYCQGFQCLLDKITGSTCTRNAMCLTGYCSDGYCCNGRCDAFCYACSNAKTGYPNGQCQQIKPKTDPDNECPDDWLCYLGGCCDPTPGAKTPVSQPQKDPIPVTDCP